jgi:hypothetical protein
MTSPDRTTQERAIDAVQCIETSATTLAAAWTDLQATVREIQRDAYQAGGHGAQDDIRTISDVHLAGELAAFLTSLGLGDVLFRGGCDPLSDAPARWRQRLENLPDPARREPARASR